MPPTGKKWGKNPPRSRRSTPRRRRVVQPEDTTGRGDGPHADDDRQSGEADEAADIVRRAGIDPEHADLVADIIRRAGEPPGYRELLALHRQPTVHPSAVDGWLMYYERPYADTKNPVFAFEALGLLLRAGAPPLPEWLYLFLIELTEQFGLLSRRDIPTRPR